MNYQIQSGDCLSAIVQQRYGLTNDADIQKKVAEIARANNIENPDLIFAGDTLVLDGEGDNFTPSGDIDNWLNQGAQGDFKMFEKDNAHYGEQLKGFAQSYINKYDKDGDGKLNQEEFLAMESQEQQVSDVAKGNILKAFSGLNLDNDGSSVTANELASMFYTADFNAANKQDGDPCSVLDGKFNIGELQNSLASLIRNDEQANATKAAMQKFHNHFYGQNA